MNALELAERLETDHPLDAPTDKAAAELRRLHAINAELVEALEKSTAAMQRCWNLSTDPERMSILNMSVTALQKAKP
jgi:hypothetical protein